MVQQASKHDPAIDRAGAEGYLKVVPSGNDLPVIDLRQVITASNYYIGNCDHAMPQTSSITLSVRPSKNVPLDPKTFPS